MSNRGPNLNATPGKREVDSDADSYNSLKCLKPGGASKLGNPSALTVTVKAASSTERNISPKLSSPQGTGNVGSTINSYRGSISLSSPHTMSTNSSSVYYDMSDPSGWQSPLEGAGIN